MTRALYLSLGHNSSAVIAHSNSVRVGYEQERIDRVKSSSAYPRDAILMAIHNSGGTEVDVAYVSHWFDDCGLKSNKYIDMEHLGQVAKEIVGLTSEFTHHDAHAQSALSFYRSNSGRWEDPADIVVMDGFGTLQECLSVYRVDVNKPNLVHRTYGYKMSLGLMYQYTTEWLGMKPNRDEYKLLGYESSILNVITLDYAHTVRRIVGEQAREHADRMLASEERPTPTGDLFDRDALAAAKAMWFERAANWRKLFHYPLDEQAIRTCVGFCAQTFIEECAIRIIEQTAPPPMGHIPPVLILAGGCFYNVKLNRRVLTETGRRIFPHPLSGDQGAAMGHTPGLHQAGLTWGNRSILGRHGQVPVGVEVVDQGDWVQRAVSLLEQDRIVNVVRGAMEFGPRALCNTTTFALPHRNNVTKINLLNERDEAMPMAPVITRSEAWARFNRFEFPRINFADAFMITTIAFENKPPVEMMGVCHPDPLLDCWTARPQIVPDHSELGTLVMQTPQECLINTSFNYHGEPIVYSEDDACKTHAMQCFRAGQLGLETPITLLVRS